jgi:hypothetical protein
MKSRDSATRSVRSPAVKHGCLSLAIAVCLSACRGSPTASLDAAAEFYVRAALALGERDADSLDIYYGPVAWQADARARHLPLDDIRAATNPFIASLDERPFDNAEAEARRLFLLRQTRAIVSRVDVVRGARPTFAEELRTLFGLDEWDRQDRSASGAYAASASAQEALRRDKTARQAQTTRELAVRSELERLLPGAGDLATRYATFDRRFLIPRDRLAAVVSRAIEGCRAATREHVMLPPGERVDVEYVPDLAWSAYTRYQGHATSRIQINTALPLTVDRALDLACHEAYPGHHTIDSLLDGRFGGRRIEFAVRPLFSPQSLLHEAAASLAAEVAFPGQTRLAFERDALFPLAGLDPSDAERYVRVGRLVDQLYGVQARVARQYLDGELDFPRASAALERDALMPSADATLKFLNQFRSYAATYTIGRDALSRYLDAHSAADDPASQWRAYINVVTDPVQVVPSDAR